MTQARSLLAPCLSHSRSQGLSKERPGLSWKKMRRPNPYVLVGRCIFQLRQGFGKESLSFSSKIFKNHWFFDVLLRWLCGLGRLKIDFRFFLSFRRRPAHIFFDKPAESSKNHVFLKVRLLMASKKTGRQKKSAFRHSGAHFFFGFQIWITS